MSQQDRTVPTGRRTAAKLRSSIRSATGALCYRLVRTRGRHPATMEPMLAAAAGSARLLTLGEPIAGNLEDVFLQGSMTEELHVLGAKEPDDLDVYVMVVDNQFLGPQELRRRLEALLSGYPANAPGIHDQLLKHVDEIESASLLKAPSAAAHQALGLARLRNRLVSETEMLDAKRVAEITHSTADNKSSTAGRLRAAGKIFGLEYGGEVLYPAFQFGAGGTPKAVIEALVQTFRERDETLGNNKAWELFIWLSSDCDDLDDQKPLDLLDKAPDMVLDAARNEMTPFEF